MDLIKQKLTNLERENFAGKYIKSSLIKSSLTKRKVNLNLIQRFSLYLKNYFLKIYFTTFVKFQLVSLSLSLS